MLVGVGVGYKDFVDELRALARKVLAEHLLVEFKQQLTPRSLLGENHADVQEQLGKAVTAEVLLLLLPLVGVRRLVVGVDVTDHLRLENVRRGEVQTTRVHYTEDAMSAC